MSFVLLCCWVVGGLVYYCCPCLTTDWISPERKLDFSFPFTPSLSFVYMNWLIAVRVITFPSPCCSICCSLINCIYTQSFLSCFWWQQKRWRESCVYAEPGAHAGLTCAASARAGLGVCWWKQGVALALGWGWQSLQVWVSMLFSFLWLWEARAALVH